jgi:hypothetical protein
MQQDWGCCAGTMAKAMSTEFNTYMSKLYTACGKTLDGSCSGGKALRFNCHSVKRQTLDTLYSRPLRVHLPTLPETFVFASTTSPGL